MGSIGESLKSAREAKGISLSQAEEDTKIRKRYLQALEDGEYDVIPGSVYAKGFLRNYANYLGLNQEEIMIEYKLLGMPVKEEHKKVDIEKSINKKKRLSTRADRKAYTATVAIAVFAVLILVVYNFVSKGAPKNMTEADNRPSTGQVDKNKVDSKKTGNNAVSNKPSGNQPPQQPQSRQNPANPGPGVGNSGVAGNTPVTPGAPAPGNTGTPADTTGNPGTGTGQTTGGVNVTLSGKDQVCWARITVDGEVKFSGNINPGETKNFSGASKVKVRLGNAGAVDVTFNGQNIGKIGEIGQPATKEFTNSTATANSFTGGGSTTAGVSGGQAQNNN